MYTLLYGAQKNAGDYLIYERSKALLDDIKGIKGSLELHSLSTRLEDHLDEVNQTRAVIVCGGPGLQLNLWPGKYPLASNLDDIKVPIVLMGVGWYGVPGDDETLAGYRFTPTAHQLFRRIIDGGYDIAVRDYLSRRALSHDGVSKVAMTGCPAWYSLDHLGQPFTPVETISSVVFSTPANPAFADQAIGILQGLRRRFPGARIRAAFHTGLAKDWYLDANASGAMAKIARAAEAAGCEVADLSYGAEGLVDNSAFDLHVGYRVHAHLEFMSRRCPSILIEEDGRGRGANEALNVPGVRAWVPTPAFLLARRLNSNRAIEAVRRSVGLVTANPFAVKAVLDLVDEEVDSGFGRYRGVADRIDDTYATMRAFVEALP